MPILVLRHEPFEHLGFFHHILEDHNISFRYSELGDLLDLDGYSGLIVMGGPQSANDSDPALKSEMGLIQDAIRNSVPVLGICLGSQLIAKALGALVYKNPVKEIGWFPVSFTAEAEADPLFGGLASPTMFFHWHGETFDLPDGAVWLAYSEACKHQAFRYGKNIYGVQFHPEITPEMIADWSSQPVNCGDVASIEQAPDPHEFDTSGLARKVMEGWLRAAELL
jgi:GMP synthase-like glutamine amidotransferase